PGARERLGGGLRRAPLLRRTDRLSPRADLAQAVRRSAAHLPRRRLHRVEGGRRAADPTGWSLPRLPRYFGLACCDLWVARRRRARAGARQPALNPRRRDRPDPVACGSQCRAPARRRLGRPCASRPESAGFGLIHTPTQGGRVRNSRLSAERESWPPEPRAAAPGYRTRGRTQPRSSGQARSMPISIRSTWREPAAGGRRAPPAPPAGDRPRPRGRPAPSPRPTTPPPGPHPLRGTPPP